MTKTCFRHSLLFGIMILFACTSHHEATKKRELAQDEIFINKLDAVLPRSINQSNHIIIYRYGSIEWCPYASIICINKRDLNRKKLNVVYFMCYFDMEGETLKNKPTLSMYQLKIDNPDVNAHKLDLFKLTKMTFPQLNKYVRKMYLDPTIGEGYCSNLYLIKRHDSNSMYLLQKNHPNRMSNYLKSILRKISPIEYYQSLSLEKECGTPTDLSSNLRLGKDLDSFDFAINYQSQLSY